MSSGDRLRALSAKKAESDIHKANHDAYVADRIECGWTDDDVAEYRVEVARIMKSGADDEKAAAREFWSLQSAGSGKASGINQRIRADNALAAADQESLAA